MKYKAIIFDMDGTIVDTEHIWSDANNMVLQKRGINLTDEERVWLGHQLAGRGIADCCAFLREQYHLKDDIVTLMQEKSLYAKQRYEESARLVEGFQEFYSHALQRNIKMGLATNADDITFHTTRKKLALDAFFGNHMYNISCVDNKYKPDPAIYLHASYQMGVEPQECVAIEDSAAGIRAARAAGMYCIGINTSKNSSLLHEANHIIDHYHEIDLDKLLALP